MKTKLFAQQFKVVIEQDEDGYFVASVPALPGCYTQAKTISQLMHRVKDAIRLCVSVSKNDLVYRKKVERFAYEPSFVGMEVVKI